ncbi:MAG: tryptophan 2,3-dioxygenase family protein, partial [Candidatus Sericytochromatia bacterium]
MPSQSVPQGVCWGQGATPMPQEPAVFRPSDLTYNTYLKVEDLLGLQQCQSDPAHHDEMLFIVIHQAYEL